jgi:hypothetical protein
MPLREAVSRIAALGPVALMAANATTTHAADLVGAPASASRGPYVLTGSPSSGRTKPRRPAPPPLGPSNTGLSCEGRAACHRGPRQLQPLVRQPPRLRIALLAGQRSGSHERDQRCRSAIKSVLKVDAVLREVKAIPCPFGSEDGHLKGGRALRGRSKERSHVRAAE